MLLLVVHNVQRPWAVLTIVLGPAWWEAGRQARGMRRGPQDKFGPALLLVPR